MKYLVISDIHGGYKYLDLVLNKVKDFDKLIILGDILYHGPRNDLPEEYSTKKVTESLNSLKDKIIAVRGNCDAKIDLEVLDFPIYDGKFIRIDGRKFFLTHGDEFNKDHLPTKLLNYVMLYGHFHKNILTEISKKITVINVGSLSIPKDGHYTYAVIENHKYTSYDLLSDEVILDYKF